jgi:F420-dependent oxidoreductase-like protein
MDLCLMIEGQEGVSWQDWMQIAQACERHGVPALFRSDHYMNLDGEHPEREALDAWGTICTLAALTTELEMGTMVSPATFRHPSELARLVTTADQISGGRVSLGLGAGWHEREHEAHGFPFADTRTRMRVLEEQLEIVHGTWTRSPFDFAGRHYTLKGLRAQPRPIRQPHPPLIIGGEAGPRSAALAANWADEYNTPFVTAEQARERREAVDRACEQAGRDPIPFSVMTALVVGRDQRELSERVARLAEKIGSDADQLLREPPPSWVVGTVERATEQLAALRDAGVARVMCQQLVHTDLDAIALLGDELGPRLA